MDSYDQMQSLTSTIKAAQYLRMSTEHQKYSSDNQAAAIKRYSDDNGFDIFATYADDGKSGITAQGRQELLQLIEDVESKRAEFSAVLVYDVSRWGRFQNPDDAAVYEVRCRWAGVPVHYCAEPFQNDGSIVSSIMKTLKRAMAAEYSRELSAKVPRGPSSYAPARLPPRWLSMLWAPTGVTFETEKNTFVADQRIDAQRQSFKGKSYFRDFYGANSNITISVRLDVTEFDKLLLPTVVRPLIHPYSTASRFPVC